MVFEAWFVKWCSLRLLKRKSGMLRRRMLDVKLLIVSTAKFGLTFSKSVKSNFTSSSEREVSLSTRITWSS